jgi:type I restriction enzyme, S subunit
VSPVWPQVKLGEVLRRSQETVEICPESEYREVTVRLWGKGVVQRGILSGSEIGGNRRFVARAGQFILSRIDARNGAAGIVPPFLEGAVVTNDFPLFALDTARIDPTFFGWLSKTTDFVELCGRASEGTTNRVRIQEARFLALEIAVPPLVEQRRIVARMEELAAKIAEARSLRQQAIKEVEALFASRLRQVFALIETQFPSRKLGSFSPHVTSGPRNWAKHCERSGYRFYRAQDIGPAGRISNDSKVFISPPPGQQGRSAILRQGDLMIVITGATVGRMAVFREGLEPGFVSQHVAICRLPSDQVDPDFLAWGLRSPDGQAQILGQRYGQGKPGLNLSNIRELRFSFPPLLEQWRVVEYLDGLQTSVDTLKKLQAQTAAELDAFLPSILDKAFSDDL